MSYIHQLATDIIKLLKQTCVTPIGTTYQLKLLWAQGIIPELTV
jgi:hypothetical protein